MTKGAKTMYIPRWYSNLYSLAVVEKQFAYILVFYNVSIVLVASCYARWFCGTRHPFTISLRYRNDEALHYQQPCS